MISIAIVEDKECEAAVLVDYIKTFEKEKNIKINVERFENADTFLANYRTVFDLVFMDIEMPGTDGLTASYRLREVDKEIVIIFVTNMAKYAVRGYEVDALDYIIKPMQYPKFAIKIQRAIDIINAKSAIELLVQQPSRLVRVSTKRILYIEVSGHRLSYHTVNEIINGYGTLSDLELRLKSRNFMRCNACYLINPNYVASIDGDMVEMKNGDKLKISKSKKKSFMADMTNWLGQGNFA